MDQRTDTAPEAPAFAFEQGRSRRDRRRRRQRVRALVVVAALALGVLGAFAADVVAFRGRVHRGVELAGIDLSGLTVAQATDRVRAAAEDLADDRLTFRFDEQRFETTPGALGWRPDVDATVERASAVGRSGPPWRDAATRAVTWIRPTRISWVSSWDRASALAVVRRWTEEVGAAPREGRLLVRDAAVIERNPVPGRRIAVDQLLELAGAAVEGRTGGAFRLPMLPREPRTSPEDVAAAAEVARTIVSGPVEVAVGGLELRFAPEELGPLVRSRVVDDGAGATIEVVLRPARVDELLAPVRADVEVAPSSARLTVSGGGVVVAETSRNGRRLDAERAARRLLAIATSPSRTGRIPLVVAKPELTTRQAKALGIRDRISTFTTYHAAGEPRVTNIHLAADILDGAIVMPGEEFSLNGRVGERTAERGFVQAPVIYEGRFTSDIGGGTSQLATTTFNAAFFAGFPFVEYQPHSYYISRYPMGREATVSFPKPDLRFVNDLDRPVLIVTSYTGSSITVDIWGRQQGRTVTATQPQVTSRSGGGFTVVVHRIVTQGDREVRRDTFTTFYRYG